MIDSIVRFSVHHKLIVSIFTIGIAVWGIFATTQVPIDAVPDITNNQVQIVTVSPSLSPQEVEQFITYPVEIGMANLQDVSEIRSISRYGLSVVTIVFGEHIEIMKARQLVSENFGESFRRDSLRTGRAFHDADYHGVGRDFSVHD